MRCVFVSGMPVIRVCRKKVLVGAYNVLIPPKPYSLLMKELVYRELDLPGNPKVVASVSATLSLATRRKERVSGG